MRALLASILLLTTTLCYAQSDQSWAKQIAGGQPAANVISAGVSTPDFLPVEEAYQLAIDIEDQRHVRVYWQIEEAYYLYQHRFKFQLEDASGPVDLTINFPEAITHNDEYFGEVNIYYHSADISLELQRDIDLSHPASLTLTSQGCADAGLCYPPQKQHFKE